MSSQRLLSKLSESMAKQDYYESHQIYRTLYYRLLRANKTLELSKMLYSGAFEFLTLKQYNSGADLSCLYIDLLIETNNTCNGNQLLVNTDELLANIRTLFELIPAKTPERLTFISKAVKLRFLPQSAIRRQFAIVFWREKNFAESRLHFVHSSDSGDDCALMLVEYQTTLGFPSEVDLFIGQFVLQVLCVRNKSMANQTFQAYTSRHPSINCPNPPFLLPLLNFLWFLLLAIESGKTATFKVLCDLYGTTLRRDPSYNEYLSQIGQIYFGLENASRNRGPSGFFGNLLQSLLDNGEDSDEEQSNAGPSRSTNTNTNRSNSKQEKSHEVELD